MSWCQFHSVPAQVKGYAHRCQLNIRITPDIAESYTTSASYPSTRQAKEAAAQLALAEGVVMLFKLHNSLTTKICRQLELPIPSNVEDHDTAEEENTAGLLAQLVQQVIGRPDAITTEYTSNRNGTCKLLAVRSLRNHEGSQEPQFDGIISLGRRVVRCQTLNQFTRYDTVVFYATTISQQAGGQRSVQTCSSRT